MTCFVQNFSLSTTQPLYMDEKYLGFSCLQQLGNKYIFATDHEVTLALENLLSEETARWGVKRYSRSYDVCPSAVTRREEE